MGGLALDMEEAVVMEDAVVAVEAVVAVPEEEACDEATEKLNEEVPDAMMTVLLSEPPANPASPAAPP